MTHLYGARGSFHVLGSKDTIKLVTQSAEKVGLYGKMGIQNFSHYFLKDKKAPEDRILLL